MKISFDIYTLGALALYSGLCISTDTALSSSDFYSTPLFQSLTCELDNVSHNVSWPVNDHHTQGIVLADEAVADIESSADGPSSSWEVRPSPGKGLGVFATTTIKAGERIMVEEPLFTITPPEFVPGRGYELAAMKASLEAALESLPPMQRDEFHACHAHYLPGEGAETGNRDSMVIFRSNAYTLTDGTIAMFPRIARINHSCRPNAANVWSAASGLRVIWAARDIAADEEVTVTYAPLLQRSEGRQRRLEQYGFECSCEACRDHALTDPVRVRMGRLLAQLEDRLVVGRSTSAVANRKLLPKALELVALMEAEHMMDYLPDVYHLAAELCLRLEDYETAAGWSMKALRLYEYADESSSAAESERRYLENIPSNS